MKNIPNQLRILCLGNSFSDDTIEHVANIALSLGIKNIKIGNLMIGGCSINKHYHHLINNVAEYEYRTNDGGGWNNILNVKSLDVIKNNKWDFISIQHGSADGSLYTKEESYQNLPLLINEIKKANPTAKIVFNMAWVGEEYFNHPELISYGRNQILMYTKLAELTQKLIVPMKGIEFVSPTGTAVQNARTSSIDSLSRDGYHLSLMFGRYLAGLIFIKTLLNVDINNIQWKPNDVTEYQKNIAIEAVNNAYQNPFIITKSNL